MLSGFEKNYVVKNPEEFESLPFSSRDDRVREWCTEVDSLSVVSAIVDCEWAEENKLKRKNQKVEAKREVRNSLLGLCSTEFVKKIMSSEGEIFFGSRAISALAERAVYLRSQMSVKSNKRYRPGLFALACSLGSCFLPGNVSKSFDRSAEWLEDWHDLFRKTHLLAEFTRDVANCANLYEQPPFKKWDPVGEVKGRSFDQRAAASAKSDSVFSKTVKLIKEQSLPDRFPFESESARTLFAAESVHAMNGVLVVRVKGRGLSLNTQYDDPKVLRHAKRRRIYEENAEIPTSVAIIASEQLVDLCNIIAGSLRVESIERFFMKSKKNEDKIYGERISAAKSLILGAWRDEKR